MGKGTSKANRAKVSKSKANGKEGSLKGLQRDSSQSGASTLSIQEIKKNGFKNAKQITQYYQYHYLTQDAPNINTLRQQLSFRPLYGDMVMVEIQRGAKSEAKDFTDWIKNRLNVNVEGYGNNSYIIHTGKKRKR